jgi:hypothetical protein
MYHDLRSEQKEHDKLLTDLGRRCVRLAPKWLNATVTRKLPSIVSFGCAPRSITYTRGCEQQCDYNKRIPSDRQLESNIPSKKENRITLSSNRSLSQDDQEEQEDKVLRTALAHLIMVGEIVVGNGDIS